MRKIIYAVAFIIAAALALFPVSAQAHMVYQYQGSDVAYVSYTHQGGGVKDMECDGSPVYLWIFFSDGTTTKRWDSDGCKNGYTYWTTNRPVKWTFLCEKGLGTDDDVCSPSVIH